MSHKQETKPEIHLIQFANYTRPVLSENKSRNWVLNGKNNEFYQTVIDLYNGSPTNASIINTYISLIYGKGIRAKNAARNTNDWAQFKTILNDKDLRKLITDYVIFGGFEAQVIQSNKKGLSEIAHIPTKLVVPSIENEDCEIESYWYSKDWTKLYQNTPVEYPAFSGTHKLEIYSLKPYTVSQNYFAEPAYMSGMPYAEMEMEIANMNVNSIKNGLSAGYIINIPDGKSLSDLEKTAFEKDIRKHLTGSENATRFVLSYNGRDAEITIIPIPINDNVHKQWESLNETATTKLLTAHRATNSSIVGISTASGFSSTAEEMEQSRTDLMKYVIQSKQDEIVGALEEILVKYGINLDLFFEPLTEVAGKPVELSSHVCLSDTQNNDIAEALILRGEDVPDGYEIVEEERCDIITLKENDLNTIVKFASVPVTPRKKSDQDTSLFKIRYRYAGSVTGQREFCKKVLNADKIYRSEDLDFNSVYNEDFAPKGSSSYNIFLYKGGVNCNHWWKRVILLKKDNETISVNEARKMILELEPKERRQAAWEENDKKVAKVAEPSNNWWSLQPNYRNSGTI